jgi:hypothetical protein
MEQKSLIASMAFAAALAVVPVASAGPVITDHSGTICKNYHAGDVGFIDHLIDGTRSLKSSATWVICPLTRNTSNDYGATAYVDISHSGTQTTSCELFSYSDLGNLLGASGAVWTGSGFHEFFFNLSGFLKSDAWSNYSVLCLIPGNASGLVIDVDLYEN